MVQYKQRIRKTKRQIFQTTVDVDAPGTKILEWRSASALRDNVRWRQQEDPRGAHGVKPDNCGEHCLQLEYVFCGIMFRTRAVPITRGAPSIR